MKIAIFSTSSRQNSNTLRFSRYAQRVLQQDGHDVALVSFEAYDIPFTGQGSVKPDTLTPFQDQLISAWDAAELILFAMPEYNWTAPPQVDNTFNQLAGPTFKHLFDNKVFALVGVSNGRGGRQPALDATVVLNKVISFTNVYSIVSPKIYESHETDKNVSAEGEFIGHEVYNRTARAFLDYSVNVAQRWTASVLSEK